MTVPEVKLAIKEIIDELLIEGTYTITTTNDYGSGGELFECVDTNSILNLKNNIDYK